MRERDGGSTPDKEKRHDPDVSRAPERAGGEEAPGRTGRTTYDDWQALATEDPAFFIKTSDPA
jgi:hypothetical protein